MHSEMGEKTVHDRITKMSWKETNKQKKPTHTNWHVITQLKKILSHYKCSAFFLLEIWFAKKGGAILTEQWKYKD